ncbi:MAG: histidinol dehydrogenase [Blastocatellia bacterium]|nr:histidinol dehydrogenase [Blastocatellia bacterium]
MISITTYKPGEKNEALDRIRSRSLQVHPELIAQVEEIVEGVRAGGDEAVIHYTKLFDNVELKPSELRIPPDFIRETAARAEPSTVEAFSRAVSNVRAFHERQRETDWFMSIEGGAKVGQRILPVASAGLYVPGGRAAYPSSLIMNAVPARVAGVPRIAITTPPGTLERAPAIAAVLVELRIEEVYQMGGAQAIAALAFGTESVPRVDKIAGPGNIYVAIAKKIVYGSTGIDSIAGPTEVVVLADDTADARFIAADLLAQAEHDRQASAILITTSQEIAQSTAREITEQIAALERSEIARASIESYGAVFVVESVEAGCELVNLIAPEHLELMTADNERAAGQISNAGALFFGAWSPEPVGDYFAGPNHVLPTMGTARFSSPLGVYDFLKRQSVIHYTREAIRESAVWIARMADAEGLTAHKQAVLLRTQRSGGAEEQRSGGAGEQRSRGAEEKDIRRVQEQRSRAEENHPCPPAPLPPCTEVAPAPLHPCTEVAPAPLHPCTEVAPAWSHERYLERIKPAVRAITAYTLAPYRAAIKINQNESPFDMPEEIKEEVARRLASRAWSRYPDFVPSRLLERLAEFAGWKPEGTLAGNGSNELIQATLMVTVGPGRRVLIAEPTFTLYRQIVTVLGGEAISVPLTSELQFDIDAIRERAASERADVIILCSPNNPTGCRASEEDILRLARDFDGLMVVDEAYHEFSGRSTVPLLEEMPNLIVLRTFSKAMAMAGLRVGYLLASPEIAAEIHKATLPYNLNFFSATAAEVACEKYELLRPQIETIIRERERIFQALTVIRGLEPVPSSANFLLARAALNPQTLFKKLLERDILVRDVSRYPMLDRYVRISVGTPEENDRLIAALEEIMAAGPDGDD